MKKQFGYIVVISAFVLVGCQNSQQKFTERMAGSAESVNGIVYVMGGMTFSENVPYVGAFDPSAKTWASKASIPTPRSLGGSVVHGNDIYVIGGRNENAVLSTVEKYITTENRWERRSSMPTARWSLMVCASTDKLYALGGIAGTGNSRRALDVVEAYDPKSDSWQFVSKMPDARQGAAVAAIDGLIYVISGKIASWAQDTKEPITERVDSFDPKTMKWTRLQDIPTGRVGARAIAAHGLIFVVGGIGKGGDFPTAIDVFDPRLNQWRSGPNLSSGRSGHMCALSGDSIIVFGGSSVKYGSGKLSISGTMETISISAYQQK